MHLDWQAKQDMSQQASRGEGSPVGLITMLHTLIVPGFFLFLLWVKIPGQIGQILTILVRLRQNCSTGYDEPKPALSRHPYNMK